MSETTDKAVAGSLRIAASPVQEKKLPDALAKSATEASPQQQYKIVKVRKPDGTIVKVRRPITAEEAAEARSGPAKAKPVAKSAAEKKSESTIIKTNNLVESTSTTKTSSFESTTVDVKSLKTSQGLTTTSSTVTLSVPTTKLDNIEKSSVTVTPLKKEIPAEKISNKASQESSKPTEPSAPLATDQALNTAAKGARFYRGLHQLHKGSSRLISILAPELDIGDLKDGDEEISDDDDDDDDEQYESDDEKNGAAHGSQGTASTNANAASKEIATTAAANMKTSKATKQLPSSVEEMAAKKSIDNNTSDKAKSPVVVSERELSFSDLEKCSFEKPVDAATEDKSLRKHYKDWSRYIIYAIMMLFPLLFMVIGILVAFGNKKSTDSRYINGTNEALTVAISVWPIIFAGIVAQSLRAFATYKVERGVRLMTLEQLVNSNSVASSFKQPFLLRRFNWITMALLALWGLSPLATQAMQRISTTADLVTPTILRFQDTTTNEINYLSANTTIFDSVKTDFERVWSASLLFGDTIFGMDLFGNALIPSLDTSQPTGEWQNTDPTDGHYPVWGKYAHVDTDPSSPPSAYLSNIGVPVATSDNSASDYYDDVSFSTVISTGYLDVSCAPLTVINLNDPEYDLLSKGNSSQDTLFLDMTPMGNHRNGSITFASLITSNITNPGVATSIQPTADDDNDPYAYTTCNFTQVLIDATIFCQSNQCYTTAIRLTPEEEKPANDYAFSGVENWLTEMFGERPTDESTLFPTNFELWLNGTDRSSSSSGLSIDLTALPQDFVEYKLAVLMNTWWTIGFSPANFTTPLSNSTDNPQLSNTGVEIPISWGRAVIINSNSMFVTRWGWLAVLILCSTALLLAGIFSILWDARTVSPDVLGFASSVVRKSKYVQLPKVNSAASGAERARALGEVRVMMQDVKPTAEVGRIALGTAHANAQKLTLGRIYR